MRRIVAPLVIGITLIAATPAGFGGWAVVTVEDLPEYLVAGEPTTLAFTIRHHGRTLMDDRSPSVILGEKRGWLSKRPHFDARRRSGTAVYETAVTADETGHVLITIDADYRGSRSTLLPIPVVAAGEAPASPPAHGRGRNLFVAKGCATCHVKADDDLGEQQVIPVGPNLTNRTFEAEWLARKLARPAQFRAGTNGEGMPDLGLAEAEIAALVSYLNRPPETAVSSRK